MKLEDWRNEIDEIDQKILALLNQRAEIVKNVGILKAQAGLPIIDQNREAEILQKLTKQSNGVLKDRQIIRIYAEILQESREIQQKTIAEMLREEEVLV